MSYLGDLKAARLQATKTREALKLVDDRPHTTPERHDARMASWAAELALQDLLVNKAEAIERLIDAVDDAMPELDVPCRDACIHFDCGAIRGMEIALAALDGPTEKI